MTYWACLGLHQARFLVSFSEQGVLALAPLGDRPLLKDSLFLNNGTGAAACCCVHINVWAPSQGSSVIFVGSSRNGAISMSAQEQLRVAEGRI